MPVPESTPPDPILVSTRQLTSTDEATGSEATTPVDETVGSVVIPLSFDAFYGNSFDSVARALGLTLANEELGIDAASEAMARAYQRWSKISGYDNPSGWVYRVGLNWARSRRRKWKREIHVTRAHERSAEDPRHDHALASAIAELPLDQRSVVVLRYFLDLSEADTASALNIAPGTVKSRLSRALGRLANAMENDNEPR
jgi:RNA polymerase sigma factor (sigma-70 family)